MSLEWKRIGVMDNDSGDDETDELRELNIAIIRLCDSVRTIKTKTTETKILPNLAQR